MTRAPFLALTAILLLSGCETTNGSRPVSSAPTSGRHSALAVLTPADAHERELLAPGGNADALAKWAVELGKRADRSDLPDEAKALRLRARRFALAAQERGSGNLMIDVILSSIADDGSPVAVTYSSQTEANQLVSDGEKKFGRGDLDGALACYERALAVDPHCHRAALFAGDVFFSRGDNTAAVQWFDRAITIDPDVETAHRYRGDALVRLGQYTAARDSYIATLVAAPYSKISRAMLLHWAAAAASRVQFPDVSFPRGSLAIADGKMGVNCDPRDGALSLAYVIARAAYVTESKIPLASYRHSLAEEADGLRKFVLIADELKEKNPRDPNILAHSAVIEFLAQMDRDGLLEAHILLDRTDAGIAADYADYRAQHRDQLSRYVRTVWLGAK